MAKYLMICDGGHFIDGIEFDEFEDAADAAVETLVNWVIDAQYYWSFDKRGLPKLSEAQIEAWDSMIEECCTYVVCWDEDTNEWNSIDYAWFPPEEAEDQIGWMPWDQLKKKLGI